MHRPTTARIIGSIAAVTAVKCVGAAPAAQEVVAGIACQRVVVIRADQAGNAAIAVTLRVAGVLGWIGQVGGHARLGMNIGGIVERSTATG